MLVITGGGQTKREATAAGGRLDTPLGGDLPGPGRSSRSDPRAGLILLGGQPCAGEGTWPGTPTRKTL